MTLYISLLFYIIAFSPRFFVFGENALQSNQFENGASKRQAMNRPGELVDFQVYEPVLVPQGSHNDYGCIRNEVLMEYTFRNSYGAPYVGDYTPPTCDFNRVVMNLTVTSEGRQYDRLALMYLGDTEVFRTSTAEPTSYGIIWTYLKEMQQYNALWRQPQKLIFDLGNIQNSNYTGAYEVTLTATYFTVPDSPPTANQVLPISSRSSGSNKGSAFQVPGSNASVQYILPKDTNRAVVSLQACGQSDEEFWYSNAPTSAIDTFDSTTGQLLGGGTFREVQLLIDGQLSGVSWPFPVIFTGGIVPGFWRPIVGIDAFDLKQSEIDITPWLGHLLDGKAHTFEIRVASVKEDAHGQDSLADTPTSYWLISGSIFLFTDQNGGTTSGNAPVIKSPPIDISTSISTTKTKNGTNETLTYNTKASRSIHISSEIILGNGTKQIVSWQQELKYNNYNHLTSFGAVQYTTQSTMGTDVALSAAGSFSKTYSFPLTVNSSYIISDNGAAFELTGKVSRGKQMTTLGNPVFPSGLQNFRTSSATNTSTKFSSDDDENSLQTLPGGAAKSVNVQGFQGVGLDTTQVGSAYFSSMGVSYGTTEQWFSFGGAGSNTAGAVTQEFYNRHVKAVNSSVVEDQQILLGRTYGGAPPSYNSVNGPISAQNVDIGGVKQYLGRGPGRPLQGLGSKGST